jgi:hypothetical protein
MLPLPAERGCRSALLFDEVCGNEPRDPIANGPARTARSTDELTGRYVLISGLGEDLKLVAGKGADEVFEQGNLHAAGRE